MKTLSKLAFLLYFLFSFQAAYANESDTVKWKMYKGNGYTFEAPSDLIAQLDDNSDPKLSTKDGSVSLSFGMLIGAAWDLIDTDDSACASLPPPYHVSKPYHYHPSRPGFEGYSCLGKNGKIIYYMAKYFSTHRLKDPGGYYAGVRLIFYAEYSAKDKAVWDKRIARIMYSLKPESGLY
jgi:hypothetical protein